MGWFGDGCRVVAGCAVVVLAGPVLAAQEFHPPTVQSAAEGTSLGLFGFGVRGGVDLASPSQWVFGVTFDAGNLASNRLRLRPSGEIGVFNGLNSYAGSLEGIYRFAPDQDKVAPYVGAGLSLVGHDRCGADPKCPNIWANAVIGFELHYRSTFNWVLEYHGMRAFSHNRFYLGLTTRRGN